MTTGKNIKFTKLEGDERNSKLRQMGFVKSIIKIWVKGKKDVLEVNVDDCREKTGELELSQGFDGALKPFFGSKVLFNANLRGMEVFGSGSIEKKAGRFIFNTNELYKCERRKNYRLVTYFKNEALINIQIDKNDLDEQKKVLDFDRHMVGTQTILFKEFLKMIGQEGGRMNYRDLGDKLEISYRIIDISATGAAFKIGEFEKSWFEENKRIGPFVIVFDDIEYIIPSGRVVYILDFVDPQRKGINSFKVGMEFSKIPEDLYARLTRHINKELEEVRLGSEFEDFLK